MEATRRQSGFYGGFFLDFHMSVNTYLQKPFTTERSEAVIILVGGEKGGPGKPPLATNLAAVRATDGYDVLLVDTDVQGSASFWAGLREDQEASQFLVFRNSDRKSIRRLNDSPINLMTLFKVFLEGPQMGLIFLPRCLCKIGKA